MTHTLKQGAWLSDGSSAIGEIVAGLGYDFVVLDIEHGSFDLATLERFIPLLKGLGLEVLSKVLVPERGAIQQALDFGSDGVIIPHIEGLEHAKRITDFAKFPPLGSRSLAGGRTMGYRGYSDEWIAAQDRDIKVLPMVGGSAGPARRRGHRRPAHGRRHLHRPRRPRGHERSAARTGRPRPTSTTSAA